MQRAFCFKCLLGFSIYAVSSFDESTRKLRFPDRHHIDDEPDELMSCLRQLPVPSMHSDKDVYRIAILESSDYSHMKTASRPSDEEGWCEMYPIGS